MTQSPKPPIDRLLAIMARLRDPQAGCPWDLEQDFSTIAPYTIEEAYEVADAIERGPEMTALADGVRGRDRLETGIKFMVFYGSAMGSSQHGDINRTRQILDDESKCEFIVGMDNQMTSTMKLCDLVLPDTTTSERWDLVPSEYTGDMAYEIMCEQAIAPLYESRTAIDVTTALVVVSEVGADMGKFPSDKHFASWLGLCPGTKITGGKVMSGKTKRCANRAAQALRSSQSALGAYYRRMCARMDKPKAVTAAAHKLARLIYAMLTHGQEYTDRGQDYFEERYRQGCPE